MSGNENLWYVKTPDGDVHRVTLDQLDEAFQAGSIDANVMVLPAGATTWAKLGELAGIDEPAPPPPSSQMPFSLRPVSVDLSLDTDLDENAFRKKSPKRLVLGAAACIFAILGGLLVMNRLHVGPGSSTASAAAPPVADVVSAALPPAPVDTTPAAPLPLNPVAPAPTDAVPASNAAKLTDAQRAKLALADKALEAKAKAQKKNRAAAAPAPHRSSKYKSQGFTSGGSKFDPLNANL